MVMAWSALREKGCGVATFSFRGSEVIPPHGLDIDLGDVVFIIEECGDWYRGYVKTRRSAVGLFPSTYVQLKPPPASIAAATATSNGTANGNGPTPRVSLTLTSEIRGIERGGTDRDSLNRDRDREREKERKRERERESALLQAKLEDSVVSEAAEVVREWAEHWKRIYSESGSSAYQFDVIHRGIRELIDGRKQLITGTLTQDQIRELKVKLTRKVDWGNRRLGLDLVPRIGFEKANPEELGAVELYNVHVRSVENADAIRGSGTLRKKRKSIRPPSRRALSYHLLLSVRDFSYQLNDDCEIYFSLYDGGRSQFITERFMVKFSRDGMSNFVDKLQCQGLTVFEDLGLNDLSKDLYLVVQVVRIGKMFYSDSHSNKKSSQFYKRPFAGGVLNIGDIVNVVNKGTGTANGIGGGQNGGVVKGDGDGWAWPWAASSDGGGGAVGSGGDLDLDIPFTSPVSPSFLDEERDRELAFKLYSCDEKDFWQLHELLIRKHMSKVSLLSHHHTHNNSVIVTLKLLSGDLQHIRLENPVLFNSKAIISSASSLVITKKLGFPDVIMPGDVRNDMYLILESGEFEKSGKTTGKNIEVTVLVIDMEMEGAGESINSAAGEKDKKNGGAVGFIPPASYIHVSNGTGLVDEYQSVIFYHHNSPKWHETIRLSVPIEKFPSCHVRIEYRHCSKTVKEKNEKKLLGFSFMKLMNEEGTTIEDGPHELFVYKCEDKAKLKDPRNYLNLPSFNVNLVAGSGTSVGASNASKDSLPSKDGGAGAGKDGKEKDRDSKGHRDSSDSGFKDSAMASAVIGNQLFQRSSKEVLNISTLLVSTKLTQNMDLVSLLKWKQAPVWKVRETLQKLAHMSGEEVVKFLQDVLDVLFAMFLSEEGESNAHSGNVFVVLVNIFSMLEGPKFEHFKPVIDQYIMNHFAAALVYKGLLTSICHYAKVLHNAPKESLEQIQKCFETVEYTFKFIIQSHILFTRASGGAVNDSLLRDVQEVFEGLTEMMTPCAKCIVLQNGSPCLGKDASVSDFPPIKSALLYNLSKIYTQLLRVMSPLALTQLLVHFFSVFELSDSIHPLSPAKLTALHHLVKSSLFADRECRALILPEVCKHLKHHLGLREELKLCTEVLGDILSFMYSAMRAESKSNNSNAAPAVHDDIEIVAVTTLEMLVRCVLVLERRSAIVGNLVACMVGLLQLMGPFHYNRLWDGFDERASLKDLLNRIFLVFRDLVRQDVYPPDWLTMKLVTDSIILQSLAQLAQPLVVHFLNKYCFDVDIWSQYFTLATTFLTQPGLQLERFREVKVDSIRGSYGDMRLAMGDQILSLWAELGENKLSFIPEMVGPFLEITLVPEPKLRHSTLTLFYDMLEAEQAAYGNFKQVECELIDRLDVLVGEDKGDDEYRQLFNKILMRRIEDCSPPWKCAGINFINAVTRLLERLLDYRNASVGGGAGDENRDKRMSTTVNLLNFYSTEVNRREIYLRYVYKLHDLHVSAENYIEAGFTLLLHSQMLTWSHSDEKLPPEYVYPAQTELERKETILKKVIGYFDAGKLWEAGIPLAKELAEIYESQLLEYGKLSQLLRTQATFFENMLNQLRAEPEYFRVGFFGKGFPMFVRSKEFIYRGLEYEKLGAFIQRLLVEWPNAEVLKNTPPDETILNSSRRYIQICAAKPKPNTAKVAIFANAACHGRHIAEPIQSYYNVNNVNTFQYDRPISKPIPEAPATGTTTGGEPNEFKHMWVERTTLTTSAPLPGILRWFEVVTKHVEQLTPVRFAYEKMEDVNRQVSSLIVQYVNEPTRNLNPLSMRLQGMVDAAVMGGLPKYRDAFFSKEFIEGCEKEGDDESLSYVGRLYAAIQDQVTILEHGLAVHGKLASPTVQPLHVRLVECFNLMKTTVQKDFNYSPATKHKFSQSRIAATGVVGQDGGVGGGQRDSFRKTTSGSSIVYTPLPPVPRPGMGIGVGVGIRRHTSIDHSSLSLSNRSSTSSSGYGHLVGSIFDDHQEQIQNYTTTTQTHTPPPGVVAGGGGVAPAAAPLQLQHQQQRSLQKVRLEPRLLPDDDDDDEDFYAKPDESKINQLLATNGGAVLDTVDGLAAGAAPPNVTPPPIPNRSSKRVFPGQKTHSNASTISMSSNLESPAPANKATPPVATQAQAPTEYILMPPSRVRELNAAEALASVSPTPEVGPFSTSAGAVCNESYFVIDTSGGGGGAGGPMKFLTGVGGGTGPPLPPKGGVNGNGGSMDPPQLPKRLPKMDTIKSPLTPKSSFGSLGRCSTPPSAPPPPSGAPPTPTKTPPPVPPKPRSNSINNIAGGGIEDYEFLPPVDTPCSPSYEQRFEEAQAEVVANGSATGNGTVKMRERPLSNPTPTSGETEGNNLVTTTPQPQRISSTSTTSTGSGGGGVAASGRRTGTNKEYYELPLAATNNKKNTSNNYANANSNSTNPEGVAVATPKCEEVTPTTVQPPPDGNN